MKKTTLLIALSLLAPLSKADVAPVPADNCQRIEDKVGRAGMAAVILEANENHDMPVIMMTGGANFPFAKPNAKTPEERGSKMFYRDIHVMLLPDSCDTCDPSPMEAGMLDTPIGYAAFAPSSQGMVVAGGCNSNGHTAKVTRTELVDGQTRTEELPSLPVTIAYPAFAVVGDVLYVMGGQEKADSTTCLTCCYALDLNDTNAGWKERAPMPEGRMLAAAGTAHGLIYVVGGCSLHPDAKGNAERTYLDSVFSYDPRTDEWKDTESPAPETIVGAANPMPSQDGKLYLVCGDPGNFYRASLEGKAPETHPGQNLTVYSFCPMMGKWEKEGENSVGIATAPAVQDKGTIYVISGETHPGIRTPLISTLQITK